MADNVQQATRSSVFTAFFAWRGSAGYPAGMDRAAKIFTNPGAQLTEDDVSGRFG